MTLTRIIEHWRAELARMEEPFNDRHAMFLESPGMYHYTEGIKNVLGSLAYVSKGTNSET